MTDPHTTDYVPGEPEPIGMPRPADPVNQVMHVLQEHRDQTRALLNNLRAQRDTLNVTIKVHVAELAKVDRILRADAPRTARKSKAAAK